MNTNESDSRNLEAGFGFSGCDNVLGHKLVVQFGANEQQQQHKVSFVRENSVIVFITIIVTNTHIISSYTLQANTTCLPLSLRTSGK
jgi:hypothetical protein